VLECARVLYWPKDKRTPGIDGKPGILHVKCVVADGWRMFLSSANLTEQAFRLNMELGVLVTGHRLPAMVERHFAELLSRGVLRLISG
jgi:phosphatidylserine/phosphatidylglycerophosphate/cardiolipin synthase-like enzyme